MSPPIKKKKRKTKKINRINEEQIKEKINNKIKSDIEKSLPSPKQLRKIESLPPQKRKRYVKKIALSFAKGAAGAAGVALTLGLAYKLSKKTINNEIRSAVRTASSEVDANIQNRMPGISAQLRNEIGNTIHNIEPAIENTVRTAVDTGTKQVLTNIEKNNDKIQELARDVAGAGVRGAQENISGPLSLLVGKKKQEKSEPKPPPNPENKYKNVKKQINQENIITLPFGSPELSPNTRLTRSQSRGNTPPSSPPSSPPPEIKPLSSTKKTKKTRSQLIPIPEEEQEIEPATDELEEIPAPRNWWELGNASRLQTKRQGGPLIQEVEFGRRRKTRKYISSKKLNKDLKILKNC